jgi:hypothetical protein
MVERNNNNARNGKPAAEAPATNETHLVQAVQAYLDESAFTRLLLKSLTVLVVLYTSAAVVKVIVDLAAAGIPLLLKRFL